MRRYVRLFAWVHVAVAALFLASLGVPHAVAIAGGVAGAATVTSCEPGDTFEGQTTARWACTGTFVGKDGTTQRDYVWFEVARDRSPALGDRVDIVVGAKWWPPNRGVERGEQVANGVFGLLMMAGGVAIAMLVARFGWRRLPPDRKVVGVARFLAVLPLLLAPPLLLAAVVAAVAARLSQQWWFAGIFAYAICSVITATIVVVNEYW
jgi:hypothetical protein